jgi:hypothetical protein
MADFSQEKKYNYNWQYSKFKDIAISGSNVSQLANDAGYADTGSNIFYGDEIITGSLSVSGSIKSDGNLSVEGYTQYLPIDPIIDDSTVASYIYASSSTNDLYFVQNGDGYSNTTRLRWLEGNLYTGLLYGGLISTASAASFNISSGSGIIVNLNASLTADPSPTIQYVEWDNFTNQSLTYRTSAIQTYIGIDSNGSIVQQVNPFFDGEYNNFITLGTVIHQNLSTINATITYPNVAYGYKQRTYDFIKAFGPLKLSGYRLNTSSSLGLTVGSGSAFADGRNYQVDPNNPSYILDNGTAVSKIFRYYQSGSGFIQDTNAGLGYPGIDSVNYNPNGSGSLSTVSPSKFQVQRVFWYPNSATKGIVAYYGLQEYSTISEAELNYPNEEFIETPNTQQNAVFLGLIIVKGGADFTNTNNYKVIQSSLFRAAGTGGGGGGGGTITAPGGLDTYIQYNNSGSFGGVPTLTYDGSTLSATGSFTGSFDGNFIGTSSYALTASYINGGTF